MHRFRINFANKFVKILSHRPLPVAATKGLSQRSVISYLTCC